MFKRLCSQISSHFTAPPTAEPSTLCIRHEDLAKDNLFNVHRIKGDRATIFAELVDGMLTCGGSQLVPKPLRGSYTDDASSKVTNGTRAWSRKGNSVFRARVGDKTLSFDTVDLDPVTFENGRYLWIPPEGRSDLQDSALAVALTLSPLSQTSVRARSGDTTIAPVL